MADLRTREGREQEIIQYIIENKGFSIFWVTDNRFRASAATRLVDNGRITVTPRTYPWSDAVVNK